MHDEYAFRGKRINNEYNVEVLTRWRTQLGENGHVFGQVVTGFSTTIYPAPPSWNLVHQFPTMPYIFANLRTVSTYYYFDGYHQPDNEK